MITPKVIPIAVYKEAKRLGCTEVVELPPLTDAQRQELWDQADEEERAILLAFFPGDYDQYDVD